MSLYVVVWIFKKGLFQASLHIKMWTLSKAYSCSIKLWLEMQCTISDTKNSICVHTGTSEMNWRSPGLTFHLMSAGCTAVQSSAPPCVLPGPSGAARRSRHHPWDQEPCCADPPVYPGPVGVTIIVWACVALFKNRAFSSSLHRHLHTISTPASMACVLVLWESYHTDPLLVRGLSRALLQVFSQRRVAWCSL